MIVHENKLLRLESHLGVSESDLREEYSRCRRRAAVESADLGFTVTAAPRLAAGKSLA